VIELSDLQLASLRITRFIFHVVHHGEPEPVFFDELDIEEFEPFFLFDTPLHLCTFKSH